MEQEMEQEQSTSLPVLKVTGDQILLPLGGPFSGSFLGITWETTSEMLL